MFNQQVPINVAVDEFDKDKQPTGRLSSLWQMWFSSFNSYLQATLFGQGTSNVITSDFTIQTDTSFVVGAYLKVSANLTINGVLVVVG
jgi:hypothetical protein